MGDKLAETEREINQNLSDFKMIALSFSQAQSGPFGQLSSIVWKRRLSNS